MELISKFYVKVQAINVNLNIVFEQKGGYNMAGKRLLTIITMVLIISLMSGTVVFANGAAGEEMRELEAVGGQQDILNEESVGVKKEEAVRIAKTILEGAADFEVGAIALNPGWGGVESIWNVDFYRKEAPGSNASVRIDADTGEILGYNIWENYDASKNFITRITRSEAKAIAEEYLKNKLKIDMESYELLEENPYYYGYLMGGVKEQVIHNFNYVKKFKGIPLSNYTISIGIDGESGKVRNFSYNKLNVDTSKLPSPDGVLGAESVLNKYKDYINLSLQYITIYEEQYFGVSKPRILLAYVPLVYVNMIDAFTGKTVNYDGSEIDMAKPEYIESIKNIKPMDPDAKLDSRAVNESEAKAMAQKYKALVEEILGVKFDTGSNDYYSPYHYNAQEDLWSCNWYVNKDGIDANFNITINGKTGHITNIGLGKYNYAKEVNTTEPVKEEVSWQMGKAKALELIKKLVPEQYGFFADQNTQEPSYTDETKKFMREHYYNFRRVVNGLPYSDNNIGVGIDRETGELRNFHFNWNDIDFPSISKIMPFEDAVKKYLEDTEAKLTYYAVYKYDKASGRETVEETPRLVYTLSSKDYMYGSKIIDAKTGKFVDWSGKEIKTQPPVWESELSEHWAKRSVELLITQGIIKDPFTEYEAQLTRADAVKMMSLAKGILYYGTSQSAKPSFTDVSRDDGIYFYVENAVSQKILTETGGEFRGNDKITKQEFVKLLVNMLGYSEIARHSEIFKLSGAQNIDNANVGYVAICSVLGILPVKEGEAFDGSAAVTNAEAAVAIYNALEYIK
jgi:hypothetical protein